MRPRTIFIWFSAIAVIAALAVLLTRPASGWLGTSYIGDADCDTEVTSVDATVVLQFSAGLFRAGLFHSGLCNNADTNHDGRLNAVDATIILQYTAGLIASLGPPCYDPSLTAAARKTIPGLGDAQGRIAFLCRGEIWTMRPDGSDQQQVTKLPAIDWPNVHLNRDPANQPPSPIEIRKMARGVDQRPRWLPDGGIVFSSERDTSQLSASSPPDQPRLFHGASELYRINADGSDLTRLTDYNFTPGAYPFGFDPTQKCLGPHFCHAGLLAITPQSVGPDGSIVVALFEFHFSGCCLLIAVYGKDGSLSQIDVSPDDTEGGKVFGFAYAPDGDRALVYLFRASSAGGSHVEEFDIRNLSSGIDTPLLRAGVGEALEGTLSVPAWSPADDRIAFCGQSQPAQPHILYLMDAGGGDPKALTSLDTSSAAQSYLPCIPSWSPDGRFIALDSTDRSVVIVDTETGASADIAIGGQPSWGP